MSKKRKHYKPTPPPVKKECLAHYERARKCAGSGKLDESRQLYDGLATTVEQPQLKALIANDRAALLAVAGNLEAARQGFQEALSVDPACEAAQHNLDLVEADLVIPAPSPQTLLQPPVQLAPAPACLPVHPAPRAPVKVAIVSFLFNWPSTGGGITHTVELARFLDGVE